MFQTAKLQTFIVAVHIIEMITAILYTAAIQSMMQSLQQYMITSRDAPIIDG